MRPAFFVISEFAPLTLWRAFNGFSRPPLPNEKPCGLLACQACRGGSPNPILFPSRSQIHANSAVILILVIGIDPHAILFFWEPRFQEFNRRALRTTILRFHGDGSLELP